MSAALALGLFLTVVGLAALTFGVYALMRGGREHRGGGLGPISERGIHVIAGVRMTIIGAVSLASGVYFLWGYWN